MTEESDLSIFQDALIESLTSGLAPSEVKAKLQADPRLAQYQDYINSFDPDMVDVASELIIKWSRRKTEFL